jgi:hypothetical protein
MEKLIKVLVCGQGSEAYEFFDSVRGLARIYVHDQHRCQRRESTMSCSKSATTSRPRLNPRA